MSFCTIQLVVSMSTSFVVPNFQLVLPPNIENTCVISLVLDNPIHETSQEDMEVVHENNWSKPTSQYGYKKKRVKLWTEAGTNVNQSQFMRRFKN